MALRFAPSSWVQRTSTNLTAGTPRQGFKSAYVDEAVLVSSAINFFAGPFLRDYAGADMCSSTNKMFSWTQQSAGTGLPQVILSFHSTQLANGDLRYIRIRYQFGRSFFIANNEIPEGFITIDTAERFPTAWTERQRIFSWSHRPDTGSGGQAGATINAAFFFFPGSGPGGADADWLLISGSVGSGQGSVLNVFQWWRSDDYGFTWQFVRNASSGPFTAYPEAIVRGGAGGGYRLAASIGGALMYSTDFGVTWNGTGGSIFGPKTNLLEQAGQTWVGFIPGTLTGPASMFVSCDNMASVAGAMASLAPTNTNWAAVRLSPCEVLGTISAGVGVGQHIYYSTNGGETVTLQGDDSRMNASQAGNIFMGLFTDGSPFVIGVDGKTFISGDRATGTPSGRVTCPLAFAGLKKAGIPPNCAHPILTRCD